MRLKTAIQPLAYEFPTQPWLPCKSEKSGDGNYKEAYFNFMGERSQSWEV